MDSIFDRSLRALSVFLAFVTMASVGVLLVWDGYPAIFPPRTHDYVAALSLAMIAVAYLVYLVAQRPPWREVVKALALAVAFLFWAANQFWPNLPQATLFNDLAIALFVLDVFLLIVGWPQAAEGGCVEIGGIVADHPERIAVATRDAADEVVALEGNVPLFVDTAGLRRNDNLRMLTLLLGVAAALAGLKYMRRRAKI
jgi:hypothetical protein